jgi:hypothetical protein
MSDEEFLEKIETRVMYTMLSGCEMDSHLGRNKFDPASWAVTLRADELCRLLDLAKAKEY